MSERKRAEPATSEKYLWDKPGARYTWFRIAVPTRYQPVVGKRIIQRDLGTRDRRLASLKAANLRCELHATWAAASGEMLPIQPITQRVQPDLLELQIAAAESAFTSVSTKLDILRGSKLTRTNAEYLELVSSLREQHVRLLRTREAEARHLWERVADNRIACSGWDLPKGGERYDLFVRMIAEAGIEALRVKAEQLAGNLGASPTSAVVQEGLKAKENRAAAGEDILSLFDRYAAQRLAEKRKRVDTINQDRKVVEQFSVFVGNGRSVRSLLPKDVRDWRDTVAVLPASYRKMKAYAGLSMREAAGKAKAASAKPVSPTTINKYLSTVSPFLSWCVTNGYADRNPCDGLFYDIPKGKNPRPPFTCEQLTTIFKSPLFTGFLRDGKEHKPGSRTCDDWRKWIPLVCLYTGARIGEIAHIASQNRKDVPLSANVELAKYTCHFRGAGYESFSKDPSTHYTSTYLSSY